MSTPEDRIDALYAKQIRMWKRMMWGLWLAPVLFLTCIGVWRLVVWV